jgi:hypothetical protein
MTGSVIAAAGILLLGTAVPNLPSVHDRVTAVMVGVPIAEGVLRILAGVLLWKLRASGRIVHAIAVGFTLVVRVGGELAATGRTPPSTMATVGVARRT